ncbi:proline and serine-rich protein 3 [Neoarius graeffei]|uniref:proline and serine-rich protein 3 n=1 Tax=Neoarius graeffei TaxID=443677 RepID=UPI00298CBFBC|nr:proline and serine-rich protein 3 [Neoarius graeffei]XP_060800244.1 proline and serine-rich protein 3 [Neoarius graeffei]XP_060800245.1 proline and serine-rich protein 3 [Neoarius graeffei]
MKSSEAVFTKKNPFPLESHQTKSHYSPSRAKKIPKRQKKLALSPVRFTELASLPESPQHTASLSPEDQRFLKGSHHVLLCPPPTVTGQQNFSESWPSTDQSSSPASTDVEHPQHTVTSRTQEPSVLAKYIERFRYGRPQSRGERQKLAADGADGQPFWWMSSNPSQPSSSTPTRTSEERYGGSFECRNDGTGSAQDLLRHQVDTSLSPTRDLLDLSALALSDSSHCEQGQPEILQLQERARRLLQRSEHSLSSGSSGVPISSEGLGCSDFSSPVSVAEPIRKPTVPSLIDTANLITPLPAATAPGPVGSRPRPEDDILFQWRLRRKMEQARQWSHTSSHSSALYQPLLSRLALQTQPGPSFTSAPVEATGNVSTSTFCPVLEPVPSSSTQVHAGSSIYTRVESITQSRLGSVPPCDREKGFQQPPTAHSFTQPCLGGPVCSSARSGELGSKEQDSSTPFASPSPLPAESSEGDGCQERGRVQANSRVEGERGKKKSVPFTRKKKSDRYVEVRDVVEMNQHTVKARDRNTRVQEKVRSKNKENAGHRERPSSARDVRPIDSPSPIHNTLGQVVSEVLFPSADSPVKLRSPCSSTSPIHTPPAPPRSPAPPPQHSSQPSEVIGQLMQEAQDSDGLEFEDDPLLLVLRQQREWVKEQLCEVDMMLDKFHED